MKDNLKRSLKFQVSYLGTVFLAGVPTATCSGVPTAIMFTNKLVIKNFLSISMLSQYLPIMRLRSIDIVKKKSIINTIQILHRIAHKHKP